MARRVPISLALVATLAFPAAGAGPLTQDACGGAVGVEVWKQLGSDVLENLLFAEGSLWVSDGSAGAVRRFAPDRSEGAGLTGIPSPGGLAQGPDGLIYAGWGNSAGGAIFRTGEAKVVRFDPASPDATVAVYSDGFHMPNGMVFDADGNLYASNDFDRELKVIEPDGSWSLFADVYGTNGLVVLGDDLYAAITFDQRSPIERIALDDPSDTETVAELSFGVASLEPGVFADPDPAAPLVGVKGLDDMTAGPDGALYPVANGTGELLRVDPATGDACLITGGLQNPSSVRFAGPGFADDDPATHELFVTEFSGAIRLVTWTP